MATVTRAQVLVSFIMPARNKISGSPHLLCSHIMGIFGTKTENGRNVKLRFINGVSYSVVMYLDSVATVHSWRCSWWSTIGVTVCWFTLSSRAHLIKSFDHREEISQNLSFALSLWFLHLKKWLEERRIGTWYHYGKESVVFNRTVEGTWTYELRDNLYTR